jgi:TRAP-type C4-dicarboxylate transport system permease large subunit
VPDALDRLDRACVAVTRRVAFVGVIAMLLIAGANVPLGVVYRGVTPFVVADLVKLALIVFIPALALWLPSTMIR